MKRLLLFLLLCPFSVFANTVKLAWDKNSEVDIAGYNIYRSIVSGVFMVKLNAALVPHPGAAGPVLYTDTTPANVTYYYVVRAVNQAGLESGNSNQVTANPLPPGIPTNLTIVSLTVVELRIDGTLRASGPIEQPLKFAFVVPRITPPRERTFNIQTEAR